MNEFIITVNGKKKTVKVLPDSNIEINGNVFKAAVTKISSNSYILHYGDKVFEVAATKKNNTEFTFLLDGWYFNSTVRTRLQETAFELQKNRDKVQHHSEVKSPMPGLLLKIKKTVGDSVELGEPILILEAMKMENDLRSPSSGIITRINYKEGDTVEKDSIILIIE